MDAPLIHIGSKIDKDTVKSIIDLISTIFKVGRQTGMDQDTIRLALRTVAESQHVTGTTLNGCNLTGDKTIA